MWGKYYWADIVHTFTKHYGYIVLVSIIYFGH